jgi:hypothetical protein
VVPDVAGQRDHSKLTPKFGTWGLGGKGVSEDWDGDFEFDNNDAGDGEDGDSNMEGSGMLVPQLYRPVKRMLLGTLARFERSVY